MILQFALFATTKSELSVARSSQQAIGPEMIVTSVTDPDSTTGFMWQAESRIRSIESPVCGNRLRRGLPLVTALAALL
jgi:hypothetical protein